MFDERAQQLHLLVQVRSPHLAYALAGHSFGAILSASQSGFLLQLSTMSKTHARFVAIQPRPSTYPAERSCRSQAGTAYSPAKPRIRLEAALTVTEEVEAMAWVRAAEAMVHVLLVRLLELLLLLVHRLRKVRKGVREVVSGEALAPVRWHRVQLSAESSC